ncbi:hypothetical protein QOZ80_5BG0433150 [Eleusine coracana subsp. coracana]|nr:hypothetical protein QOZ80_5BG0433150 [Eleusine coracana subsp. coracana]
MSIDQSLVDEAMADTKTFRSGKREITCQFPLDLLLEIIGRTDPATVVRCAATCKELRRRIADPEFHGCLRLRHTTERFIPSLLRGFLVEKWSNDMYIVDHTTVHATKLLSLSDYFSSVTDAESLAECQPITARNGLVLLNVRGPEHGLFVFSPATGHSQSIPPGPTFDGTYVLLVGDGALNRPFNFKVIKVRRPSFTARRCSLQIQTFSSEQGTWGPLTEVPTPLTYGTTGLRRVANHLVISDTVHWLCHSNTSYYVLKLQVGDASMVTVTKLPQSFHRACSRARPAEILLATETVAGSPVVLLAHKDKVCRWVLSSKLTNKCKKQPEVVIENEAILSFARARGLIKESLGRVRLEWFAERSGVVLISTPCCGFFWLDIRSKEILGWYKGSWTVGSKSWSMDCNANCPYEIDLSSWVPSLYKTF